MKKRNCLLSLILACVMCLGVAGVATAADEVTMMVNVDGFSFCIQEKQNDDFSVTRTYERSPYQRSGNITQIDEAKALLVALGMDESSLGLWGDESILSAVNSEKNQHKRGIL